MESYEPYPEDEQEEESPEVPAWVNALLFCGLLLLMSMATWGLEVGVLSLLKEPIPAWLTFGNLLTFGVYGVAYRLTLLYNG